MRPVPLYLLTRISDDIETAIDYAERIERRLADSPDEATKAFVERLAVCLNEMRGYVNDAAEPMDLADPRAN